MSGSSVDLKIYIFLVQEDSFVCSAETQSTNSESLHNQTIPPQMPPGSSDLLRLDMISLRTLLLKRPINLLLSKSFIEASQ